jgi:hypothetical protein
MRILVSGGSPPVRVAEPDDFGRLHVELADIDTAGASAVLTDAGLGRIDESGHAWLDIRSLRAFTEPPAAPRGWAGSWTAMIDYARAKGWVTGGAVRVHVVDDG